VDKLVYIDLDQKSYIHSTRTCHEGVTISFKMKSAYQTALTEAREELVVVNREAKRLTLRASQLEAVVAQLEALIASAEPSPVPLFDAASVPVPSATPETKESQLPLWKAILAALNENKGDFSVPDAIKALERTGRHIESKHRLNIVRNTMIQRDDIFGRHRTGRYFVRGFEGEVIEEKEKKEG
jgi:hypothetical protein